MARAMSNTERAVGGVSGREEQLWEGRGLLEACTSCQHPQLQVQCSNSRIRRATRSSLRSHSPGQA